MASFVSLVALLAFAALGYKKWRDLQRFKLLDNNSSEFAEVESCDVATRNCVYEEK